ncbi:hypothetical protein PF005_g3618 [Phytophthora fragariae]|uniref:Uncharacterized protein n=1 Tax=Phytophthora fragariae TaxID=53985 RepID=A0A6A4A8E3_9STRA|nr:hypothetical protein PF011_g10002 [Phytophthora fragariae]KAE9230081.1 hypothetical protein PF005_g3618 [Phytophthora fragariae]KAE9254185.1 hypothetical protein PF002_g2986 [Phytophthora fragariae]
MVMYIDNQPVIKQVQNATSSSKAKHIDVKYKSTKDLAANGIIVPTRLGQMLFIKVKGQRQEEPYS